MEQKEQEEEKRRQEEVKWQQELDGEKLKFSERGIYPGKYVP